MNPEPVHPKVAAEYLVGFREEATGAVRRILALRALVNAGLPWRVFEGPFEDAAVAIHTFELATIIDTTTRVFGPPDADEVDELIREHVDQMAGIDGARVNAFVETVTDYYRRRTSSLAVIPGGKHA